MSNIKSGDTVTISGVGINKNGNIVLGNNEKKAVVG